MNASVAVTPQQKTLLEQAEAAQRARKPGVALKLLRELLREAPQLAAAHGQLGALLVEQGQLRAAEPHLLEVTRLLPQMPLGWRNLTALHMRRRAWKAALAAAGRLLALVPDEPVGLRQLAQVQRQLGEHGAALATLERALLAQPGAVDLLLARGEALIGAKQEAAALALYAPLLDDESIPLARFEPWVRLCNAQECRDVAVAWLRKRLALEPQSSTGRMMLSALLLPEGRYAEALHELRLAESADPDNMRIHHDLGVVLRFMGAIPESMAYMAKALDKDPYHVSALRVYGADHRYQYGDKEFSRLLRAAVQLPRYTTEAKVQLHYALGKAYDDVGDLAVAFDHYVEAGRMHLRGRALDDGTLDRYVAEARRRYTAELLREPGQPGCDSDQPLFVVGMPRSGTSLAEQVLASHPQIFGAGELKQMARVLDGMVAARLRLELGITAPAFPRDVQASWLQRGTAYVDYLRSCAPAGSDYRRIIDKMPGNYTWLGPIHLMLPKAKIVHTRRHPVEICLSAFRIFFPDGQLWTCDLRLLGMAYRRYHEIMSHWRAVLPPGVMLEVRYEDMVNDLPTQARRLVAHCGVEWNDACLNFHETDRAVRTASAAQVRKPVYKTSMNRWRRYEPYLKPLLQELGPLVQEYEEELATKP